MTDKAQESPASEQLLPLDPRIVNAVNNLQAQITFLYQRFGLVGNNAEMHQSDSRRTETGMGAIINTGSDFV